MDVLKTLKNWLTKMEQHRAETEARLERGRGPCPGGDDDTALVCSECYEWADVHGEDHQVGDPCPCASVRGEPDSLGAGCTGTLQYRYDPDNTDHDWDGGSCWRCQALYPPYFEGDHPLGVAVRMEPKTEIPESMVREIVRLLEESSEETKPTSVE